MNANEILSEYDAKLKADRENPGDNAAEAIRAMHPFAVSRFARLIRDDFDMIYVRGCRTPVHLLEKALTAPASKVPPKEKARVWMRFLQEADVAGYLALLVAKRVPGFRDFRNLDEDCFSSRIHPILDDVPPRRPSSRAGAERFLRGAASTAAAIAFLQAAEKDSPLFPVREMFLYACANCPSAARLAFVLKTLRPKLGRADFADALGYSPLFYAAWRCTQPDGPDWAQWLAGDEGRAFFDLIRRAGAKPGRKCRYGFSWADLAEAVAEDAARPAAPGSAAVPSRPPRWKRREAEPLFAPAAAPEAKPVPSDGDGIRALLRSDPDRGIAALVAMDYEPESLARPFGPRERILADAILDRDLPKPTRARLLRLADGEGYRHESGPFAGLPPVEARDVPLSFLDTRCGRRWAAENGGPGGAEARCTDAAFFKSVARSEYSDDVDADKVRLDPKLKKAIDADAPAQLAMQLAVSGRRVDARLLAVVLARHRTKTLEWLLANDEKAKELLDERRMLFFVCANWEAKEAVAWLERAEAKQPGVLKSCVDALGRNLLWYTLYNGWGSKIANTLLRHGCDPDAETAWGLAWRDMQAREQPDAFDVSVNGKSPDAVEAKDSHGDELEKAEDVAVVRIVRRATGETFEWTCAEPHVKLLDVTVHRTDGAPTIVLALRRGYGEVEATFVLGPDGIVRLVDVREERRGGWFCP